MAIGDLQTRRLDLSTTLQQVGPVSGIMLRVAQRDRQGQPRHFVAYLDAERTSLEVVERQAGTFQVDLLLHFRGAGHSFWHRQSRP